MTDLSRINDLQTQYPQIAGLWDNTRKGDISPALISANSHKTYYWKCEKGHVWSTSPNRLVQYSKKSQSKGCPVCARKLVVKGVNDLGSLYPKLVSEWDYEKNKETGKNPYSVCAFSSKKYWWKCKEGHTWSARVSDRTKNYEKPGCPYCTHHRLESGKNDIETVASPLCNQWDFTKNKIAPSKVSANSHEKYWWKCELGHEWEETPNRRVQSYKVNGYASCPKCSKFLRTSFPEKAIFYYIYQLFPCAIANYKLENNQEIDIYVPDIKLGIEYDGSGFHGKNKQDADEKKNTFCIANGINLIRVREQSCPTLLAFCHTIPIEDNPSKDQIASAIITLIAMINRITNSTFSLSVSLKNDEEKIYKLMLHGIVANSVKTLHPELLSEWDYVKNSLMGIYPQGIQCGSNIKVYWKCNNGHSWKASPNSRIFSHSGCKYCSGKVATKGENDLFTRYPDLMKEWDFELNKVNPWEITAHSSLKAYWICSKNPKHRYEARVSDRTCKNSGCPFCSSNKLLKGDNDFKTKYPEAAKEWDYSKNSPHRPEDFFPSSKKIVWWKGKCGHSYDMPIVARTGKKAQSCPYCSSKRVLEGFNDLASRYPKVAEQWDYSKNALKPTDFFANSTKKVYWINDEGKQSFCSISSKVTAYKKKIENKN